MRGCKTLIDVDAEDIIERFTEKFSSTDIKNATKIVMRFQNILKLVNLEGSLAILHNKKENSYQIIDLSDGSFMHKIDFDSISAEDAFKLGAQFEKICLEKDRKLFELTKSSQSVSIIKLVKSNEK
jgi:hypothetical protein